VDFLLYLSMEKPISHYSERTALLGGSRSTNDLKEEEDEYQISRSESFSSSEILSEKKRIFSETVENKRLQHLERGSKKKYIYGVILLLLAMGSATLVAVSMTRWNMFEKPQPILGWKYKGINFISGKYCRWVKYNSQQADVSLSNLRSTGATWTAIEISKFQTDLNSTVIQSTQLTPTDEELVHVIKQAKSLGLSVFLRPTIDFTSDPDHWRGDIGKFFTEQNWSDWFRAYVEMLRPYLELAQREGVDMISIGTDLVQTSKREAEWRSVIQSVRMMYTGKVTYSANWGGEETDKVWWNDLDVIGIDAYYPLLPGDSSPSVDELVQAWNKVIVEGVYSMQGGLAALSERWNKSVIFTEVGYCSGQCPYGEKLDLEFQRRHYVAVFEAFKNVHWFGGVFLVELVK